MMKSPGTWWCARRPNRGVRARAFDDEAQRRLRVAVARGDLARQDQLQAGVQALRDAGFARMPGFSRISTRRIASLAVISLPASIRYGRACFVLPQGGPASRRRLVGNELVQHLPQRSKMSLSMRRYSSCARRLESVGER